VFAAATEPDWLQTEKLIGLFPPSPKNPRRIAAVTLSACVSRERLLSVAPARSRT
jgi:hypothetical protein